MDLAPLQPGARELLQACLKGVMVLRSHLGQDLRRVIMFNVALHGVILEEDPRLLGRRLAKAVDPPDGLE